MTAREVRVCAERRGRGKLHPPGRAAARPKGGQVPDEELLKVTGAPLTRLAHEVWALSLS